MSAAVKTGLLPTAESGSLYLGEIPENVDVFKLAGPSDEESGSDSAGDSLSDDEWIMAESADNPAESAEGSEEGSEISEDSDDELMLDNPGSEPDVSSDEESSLEKPGERPQGKAKGKAATAEKGSKSVFASAEDFAHLIAADKPVGRAKAKRPSRR